MQIIFNTYSDPVSCSTCGQNIVELGNFIYTGVTYDSSNMKDEGCTCKKCGQPFLIRYNYFDDKGHINSFVFNGDVNDPTYNWQDQLTKEQRLEIGSHLHKCKICNDKLAEETLADAWIASLIHTEVTKPSKI